MKFYKLIFLLLLATIILSCNDKPELSSNSIIGIAPNPATRNVIVGVLDQSGQSYIIKIFDTKGKQMLEQKATGTYSILISLEDKPKGTYEVVLIIGEKSIYKKFVKI
ncbi:MAG: T9SS type A sorting domain-containing protein [Spirosomataceae bacterium]